MTYCDGHHRPAVGTIPMHKREMITGKPVTVEYPACRDCLDTYETDQRSTQPFTKEWHFAQVDRLASTMRQTVADWFECDRDNAREIQRLYGEMLVASRSLSAELSAIGLINYQEAVRNA